MSGLKKTLDDWANKLAKKATEKDTSLQESTDAFKAVTAYYTALGKNANKHPIPDEEEGGFSFEHSEVVNGSPRQRAQVRARRAS